MNNKRLYRIESEKMIGGVMAGLAEYFDHDVTVWRLGFVAALIVTGVFPLAFLYIVAWVVMPEKQSVMQEPVTDVEYTVHE